MAIDLEATARRARRADRRGAPARSAATSILARNFRTRYGELDLIAADDRAARLLRGEDAGRRARAGPATGPSTRSGPEARPVRRMARAVAGARRRRCAPATGGAALRRDRGRSSTPGGRLVALEHLEDAFCEAAAPVGQRRAAAAGTRSTRTTGGAAARCRSPRSPRGARGSSSPRSSRSPSRDGGSAARRM